jgi:hypothetical protein
MAPDGEYRWIEERFSPDNSKERAFIADFGLEKDNQAEVDPRGSVRVTNRLEQLVGERIVS